MTDKKIPKKLSFADPYVFAKVMEDHPDICHAVAELVTGRTIKSIAPMHSDEEGEGTSVETEKTIKATPESKGVRFDVYFEDESNVAYDLEMQTYQEAHLDKRFRYYQSTMDQMLLGQGKAYPKLKNSYIIFICTYDPFKAGLAKYEFHQTCKNHPDIVLEDGATKIVISAPGTREENNPQLNAFLDFIEKGIIASDLTERLDAAVKEVGQSPERRFEKMTLEQELAVREYVGEEKGKKAKNVSSVKSLMKTMGLSIGAAMEALELSDEESQQVMEALKG